MRSVVQTWVSDLTLMQQSVLLSSIRGPDGIHKDHVSKKLIRWMRRCILIAAFDGIVYEVPYDPIGAGWASGSFTGPSCTQTAHAEHRGHGDWEAVADHGFVVGDTRYDTWQLAMDEAVTRYMKTLDEVPHHFQLHFMHAAEIIGYKHPTTVIRNWWHNTYQRLVNDMHLNVETEEQLDFRLADNEEQWRKMERGVTAA